MRLAALVLAFALAATTASAQVRVSARTQPLDPGQELAMHRTLNRALETLQPQRPGRTDVYVLSVALWDEHVFEAEAAGAADVLSARFNATGRTIVLSNGQGDGAARTYGGARPGDVAIALARLGEVMDKNEDVLVLFFTTHGNRDGSMAVRDRFRDYAIYPSTLREALDQTGVKRRLVIVSACFSGAFVPALQNDDTIVFAAASWDRTSFGCEPQREWTYFGDAFINQALRQNRGLPEAFDTAKVLIESWEARDNVRPSLPTAFIGAQTQPITAAMTGRVR